MLKEISKKILISIIPVFIAALILLGSSVKAETDMPTKNASMPKYQTISNVKGLEITAEASSEDMLVFVALDSQEEVEEEWDWYTKYNYKLYYTKDAINYGSTDITAEIKKMYGVKTGERIEITSMKEKDGTFYICGNIIKKVKKQEGDGEDSYTYEYWEYETVLLKTTDGKTFEKVNIPSYKYQDAEICKYKNTYILAGTSTDEIAKYNYYTSTDLKNWTKREITIKNFTGSEEDIIKLQNITASGVSFVIGDDYLSKSYLIITSDFKTYQKVDESGVKADSTYYINVTNGERTEASKIGYMAYQDYLRPTAKSSKMDYTFCMTTAGLRVVTGNYVPSGFDFYVAPKYPGKYQKMLGFNEKWYSYRIIYQYNSENEEKSTKIPLFLFVDKGTHTTLYRYEDVNSTKYTEYKTDIDPNKIGTILSSDRDNDIVFIYDNQYFIATSDSYQTMNKIKLPIKANGGEKFKNKLIVLGEDKSLVMDNDELFDSIKTIKLGDVNADGKVNTKDAREVLLTYIGKSTLTEKRRTVADVNHDGKINTKDARQILLYYIGKIKEF